MLASSRNTNTDKPVGGSKSTLYSISEKLLKKPTEIFFAWGLKQLLLQLAGSGHLH